MPPELMALSWIVVGTATVSLIVLAVRQRAAKVIRAGKLKRSVSQSVASARAQVQHPEPRSEVALASPMIPPDDLEKLSPAEIKALSEIELNIIQRASKEFSRSVDTIVQLAKVTTRL